MPLLWLSLVFLAGILLGNALLLSITTWLILAGIFMILAVMRRAFKSWNIPHLDFLDFNHPFFTSNLPISIPVFLIVLCLGAARYQSKLPDLRDPGFISAYNNLDQQMMVTGVVAAMPEVRDSYTSLRVHVETMHPVDSLNYTEVDGLVMVRTSPDCEARYGDRVVVRGYLTTPPENEAFSYREYLARQGIYTIMSNAKVSTLETGQGNWFMSGIFKLKEKSLETVYRLWPDPEASLLAGILLGVETNIPEPVQQAFQETGTSHIIAISGFNITIIAGLFATVFGKLLNRRKGAIIAAIAISLYTILVGAAAAVVRAAIMGGLALFACQVGRRQQGINSLAITAAVMSWFAPNIPWDVSFQLSFAATLGLVLYAEPMTQAFTRLASRWLPADKAEALAKPVGEFLLFTFAAQVTTLPIMAYHFGSISWVAFLANPAILPVQPPIMILGGLSLILGLFGIRWGTSWRCSHGLSSSLRSGWLNSLENIPVVL
jgi:competence protein ComEC